MSTTQDRADRQREERDAAERDARRRQETGRLEDAVAAGVLRDLGRPADFLRADARWVGGHCYRVNVFVGPHAASARVAHSFFVEADATGTVLKSDPPVTRAY